MESARFYQLANAICLLAFLLVTAPLFYNSIAASSGLPPAMSSIPAWLESAKCNKETGAFLSLCTNDGLAPIADKAAGYDPGHPLILGLYSWITGRDIAPEHISILNTVINYAGITILSALLCAMRLPIVAFLLLTIGALISNEYHALSYHPSQFGTACLAAVLPISILWKAPNKKVSAAWIIAGLVSLARDGISRDGI